MKPKGKRPVKNDDDEDDDLGGNAGESLQQMLQALIARNSNSVDATAMHLMQRNYSLRGKLRDERQKVATLEEQLPADDAVVLDAAQAKLWTAFQALGKPDEVKANLDKLKTLTEYESLGTVDDLKKKAGQADSDAKELSTLRRGETLRKAATLAKYPADSFVKILNKIEPDLKIEFESVQVDGQQVERPVAVFKKDGTERKEPLTDYLKANHAEMMPALETGAGSGGTGNTGSGVVPVPEHTRAASAGASSLVDDFIKTRNEQAAAAPNPLMPT